MYLMVFSWVNINLALEQITNEQLGKCENFIYVQVKLKASLAVK